MIDIYGLIAVGIVLFIGAIPLLKGWHKDPDFLIAYMDNRTEFEKQDPECIRLNDEFMERRYENYARR